MSQGTERELKEETNEKITSIVSALWYKHRIMYMSDRRLIRVTRIRLRTGYIFFAGKSV